MGSFIRSDVIRSVFIRSVFIRSDVIRTDVIRSVIIRSVGESLFVVHDTQGRAPFQILIRYNGFAVCRTSVTTISQLMKYLQIRTHLCLCRNRSTVTVPKKLHSIVRCCGIFIMYLNQVITYDKSSFSVLVFCFQSCCHLRASRGSSQWR